MCDSAYFGTQPKQNSNSLICLILASTDDNYFIKVNSGWTKHRMNFCIIFVFIHIRSFIINELSVSACYTQYFSLIDSMWYDVINERWTQNNPVKWTPLVNCEVCFRSDYSELAFVQQVQLRWYTNLTMDMDMLSTLPRHLSTKDLSNDANGLNVTVPAAAAAAFQLSTNFLNAVSIQFRVVREKESAEITN